MPAPPSTAIRTQGARRRGFALAVPEPAGNNEAQDILGVVFEDEHLLVIDNPPGGGPTPPTGNRDGTVVNACSIIAGPS